MVLVRLSRLDAQGPFKYWPCLAALQVWLPFHIRILKLKPGAVYTYICYIYWIQPSKCDLSLSPCSSSSHTFLQPFLRLVQRPLQHALALVSNPTMAIAKSLSSSTAPAACRTLRLAAARALNNWLITTAEAKGGKKPVLVTVIDFSDSAHLDYPLGDPAGANSSFDGIGASGGTYIAEGVGLGISQLTTSGSGDTASRSSIIVFTDGQVSRTKTF